MLIPDIPVLCYRQLDGPFQESYSSSSVVSSVTSHLIWKYLNDFPICLVMTTSILHVAHSALHVACYISLEDVTHITATRIAQDHLRIKGDKLQVVESERLLELRVDNFLTWKAHIQNIHNTIAGKLALLCRIKHYLPYKARKTFYNSYILHHIIDINTTHW